MNVLLLKLLLLLLVCCRECSTLKLTFQERQMQIYLHLPRPISSITINALDIARVLSRFVQPLGRFRQT